MKSKNIARILTRAVDKIIPKKEDLSKLMTKRKIRLYLGIDPTATRLHMGHTINLRKLQEFADLGHEAILLIGTGTVLVGDPSLREKKRAKITEKEIKENIKGWKKQAGKIIDFSKVKLVYNGDWLRKLKYDEINEIASHISSIKLYQRDSFKRRLKLGDTVWTNETLYPLFQGYDSVHLDVDLEIGGTDQLFNMLIGRDLLRKMKGKEKFILISPMIVGTDGNQMSKTSGNCIWIEDSPSDMFGKIMSISDDLINKYFDLLTNISSTSVKDKNPRDRKVKLAKEIVKIYHSEAKAKKAEHEFDKVFRKKGLPSDILEVKISSEKLNILDLLIKAKLSSSKSTARRLVEQGGVKVDSKVINDWQENISIKKGLIISAGKRNFIKIK